MGGKVAQRLRARGDEVVALVRSPEKASGLGDLGCELVEEGLGDTGAIRTGMEDADDIADGIVAVHDRGRAGEFYVLAGPAVTQLDIATTVTRIAGKKPPRGNLPRLIKMAIPFGPLVGRMMGLEPNLREMIRSAGGVTYWAKGDRAAAELGWNPRGLEQGLRDT